MNQDESNGETSFEIVDKKQDDSNNDKTESMSSISSPYSIPSPTGNLLSNLPPPSNLPDFTLWNQPVVTAPIPEKAFPQTQFSAAIPPSKGVQHGPIPPVADSGQASGGIFTWMKDAVSSGGILSKVAEKAKNSVDTLITTLDPQMSEFIYTGGDVEISIVSQDPEEIASIREAIFAVFGKAWVSPVSVKCEEAKHRAVGFEEGVKRAEEKLKNHKTAVVTVENLLLSQDDDWFDLSVIVVKNEEKKINLRTFTQMTPIPKSFLKEAEAEMPSYAKGSSPEKLLAAYLQLAKNGWQYRVCGVHRKETIFLAAKTLMSIYKSQILNAS